MPGIVSLNFNYVSVPQQGKRDDTSKPQKVTTIL